MTARSAGAVLLLMSVGCSESPTATLGGLATAPVQLSVRITPPRPTTSDSLTANPSGSAVETQALRYEWWRGGRLRADARTLPATETRRDQLWEVRVFVVGSREPVGSAEVVIANALPTLDAVTLEPNPLRGFQDVACRTGRARDDDGDRVEFTYRWRVEGQPLETDAPRLSSEEFVKGDLVECSVTPNDGRDSGRPFPISTRVVNTAPDAPIVAIEPGAPEAGDALVCRVDEESIGDRDGDPVTVRIDWTADGSRYPDDFRKARGPQQTDRPGDTVPADDVALGRRWTCQVTVNDGEADGLPGAASVALRKDAECDELVVAYPPGWVGGLLAWDSLGGRSDLGPCRLRFARLRGGFSRGDLADTGAEVVLLSNVAGGLVEYSDAETQAILEYVEDGAGFTVTYLLAYTSVTYPSFAELAGVDPDMLLATTIKTMKVLDVESTNHPIFTDLAASFVPGGFNLGQPVAGAWEDALLPGASILARSADRNANVVIYEGQGYRSVWFTWMPEFQGTTDEGRRLLYNALIWSAGYAP